MKRYLKNVVCDVLFRNTGSTTTLLEALTNDHVDVEIVKEEIIKCHDYATRYAWSDSITLRATTLQVNGTDVSNNIVLYDPQKISNFRTPSSVKNYSFPIGRLLESVENRRVVTSSTTKKSNYLDNFCRFNNLTMSEYPVKEYQIVYNGDVYFYIIKQYLIDNILRLLNNSYKDEG